MTPRNPFETGTPRPLASHGASKRWNFRVKRLGSIPRRPLRSGDMLLAILVASILNLCPALAAVAQTTNAGVVVVYNRNDDESKSLADYYAERRNIPPAQVLGFDLPMEETISRANYLSRLETPLLNRLESMRLIAYGPATNRSVWGQTNRAIIRANIRYVVLCRGVPARILRDESLTETNAPSQPEFARRNEAAVDSQLALAPLAGHGFPWTGPLPSPFFALTNATLMNPMNGLFLVARLDGPSPAIARQLVDQAINAETNGLCGRAYFDARGLGTNESYGGGDQMIRAAAGIARNLGYETILDDTPATFAPGYPLSQIAFYAGWYDQKVSGPFARRTAEFMPGAFAYHLYSFSASTLRSTSSWAGLLLDLGATCTMGCVDEPYLTETPDISQFLAKFILLGFSFGEAAYAAQPSLSWQTTVLGDPLYRPFGRPLDQLLAELQRRDPARLAWFLLMGINQRTAASGSPVTAVQALEALPAARKSAILTEKLADLYWARGSMSDAVDSYEAALKRGPSVVQRRRLLLTAAEKRVLAGPDEAALTHYNAFLAENPDHPEPDRIAIYQAMLPLARRRNLTNEISRIEAELKRLTPAK
jgi:uncharacterized protein (TIGR03790 family)